jgi:hypothetical protein
MLSLYTESNDNGIRLINYAASVGMITESANFPHQKLCKFTWRSPDGNTTNQIDHVLVDAQHRSSANDVRSHRGPNTDSNHFLPKARIHSRINK